MVGARVALTASDAARVTLAHSSVATPGRHAPVAAPDVALDVVEVEVRGGLQGRGRARDQQRHPDRVVLLLAQRDLVLPRDEHPGLRRAAPAARLVRHRRVRVVGAEHDVVEEVRDALAHRPEGAHRGLLVGLAERDPALVAEPDDPAARALPQPQALDGVREDLDVERPPPRPSQVLGRLAQHALDLDEEHRHRGPRRRRAHGPAMLVLIARIASISPDWVSPRPARTGAACRRCRWRGSRGPSSARRRGG